MNEADSPRRIALVDVARGVALIAMAIFHGAWDVAYFRLVRFDPGESLGWTLFARSIAATFLIISGVSLVLAMRGGWRPRAYWKRLGMIVAAALLVSVATWFVMGPGWVFFGILHQIAVASVLGLPFLAAPIAVVLAVAAVVLGLPFVFRSEIFAMPALWWTGLAPLPPPSFDYVPVFPWFGAFLVGIALARIAIRQGLDRRLAAWVPRRWPGRLLALGGRHSLLVYLVHQPILFGFFFLVANVLLPGTAEQAARADCHDSCVARGFESATCTAYCGCVYDTAEGAGLKAALVGNRLSEPEAARIRDFSRACIATVLQPQEAPQPQESTQPDDGGAPAQ